MNRRQKKKQFKKEHGYNPPKYCNQKFSEKKVRIITCDQAEKIAQQISRENIDKIVTTMRNVFTRVVEEIGKVATNMEKTFRDLAAAYKIVNIGETEASPVVVAKALRERRIKQLQIKRRRVYRR